MTDEEHDQDGEQLHVRTVGGITNEGLSIQVDHVYTMETCEHGHPEPGQVGFTVEHEEEDGEVVKVSVLLIPDDALVVANRLQRAANLVMEAGEDVPDPEREYRRHAADEDS